MEDMALAAGGRDAPRLHDPPALDVSRVLGRPARAPARLRRGRRAVPPVVRRGGARGLGHLGVRHRRAVLHRHSPQFSDGLCRDARRRGCRDLGPVARREILSRIVVRARLCVVRAVGRRLRCHHQEQLRRRGRLADGEAAQSGQGAQSAQAAKALQVLQARRGARRANRGGDAVVLGRRRSPAAAAVGRVLHRVPLSRVRVGLGVGSSRQRRHLVAQVVRRRRRRRPREREHRQLLGGRRSLPRRDVLGAHDDDDGRLRRYLPRVELRAHLLHGRDGHRRRVLRLPDREHRDDRDGDQRQRAAVLRAHGPDPRVHEVQELPPR